MSLIPGRVKRLHEIRFLRFALVGTAGFLVNEFVLFLALHFARLNKFEAWFPAFAVAVTFTWWGNRTLTFRERAATSGLGREWLSFVIANSLGALANLSVYSLFVSELPEPWNNPLLANVVATLVGLVFNFTVSARFVFRGKAD
ncbi:MAG: GtrA family protein [Rhizomicrobium sp.]